ncbi:MAG: GNAT family N-acetyltransferase [Candidatus Omnitrophica bacterium]|nr:GNAT family N-acetyltransferase [Candidatus Omnitrophota bacterium]
MSGRLATVELLSEGTLEHLAESLVELDQFVVAEMAELFSSEPWLTRHFAMPLPDKWNLSCVATEGREVTAFVIGSRIAPDTGYIHRFVVAPAARSKGVGSKLLDFFHSKAGALGLNRIFLEVNRHNSGAVKFYRKNRYLACDDEQIRNYLIMRDKLEEAKLGDSFYVEEGFPDEKCVMQRMIR